MKEFKGDYLRKKIKEYVQSEIPYKIAKEGDYRRVLAIFSILNELDNKLIVIFEDCYMLDMDDDWMEYVNKYKFPEIEKELELIDPEFFDVRQK